jgi:hypothetical protein
MIPFWYYAETESFTVGEPLNQVANATKVVFPLGPRKFYALVFVSVVLCPRVDRAHAMYYETSNVSLFRN